MLLQPRAGQPVQHDGAGNDAAVHGFVPVRQGEIILQAADGLLGLAVADRTAPTALLGAGIDRLQHCLRHAGERDRFLCLHGAFPFLCCRSKLVLPNLPCFKKPPHSSLFFLLYHREPDFSTTEYGFSSRRAHARRAREKALFSSWPARSDTAGAARPSCPAERSCGRDRSASAAGRPQRYSHGFRPSSG